MTVKVQQYFDAKNQFIISTPEGTYFQSYNSVIAFIDKQGHVTMDKEKCDYSVTTGKYRNRFLGKDKRETEARIKAGVYTLADLN